VEQVHFHEVGAVDSIIDMVGVCVALDLLGIEQVYASALPLGRGWVNTQHGPLPVPAPATLEVLAEVGAPVVPTPAEGELLTPTAAALLAELAQFQQPPMRVQQVGYGFGAREFARLNGLRVWLGEGLHTPEQHIHHHEQHEHSHDHHHGHDHAPAPHTATVHEPVHELRCNLDDATGEVLAYAMERLREAGALDAWAAPLVMKKGRPAVQLACLARRADVAALADLLLRETPTLGVRWQAMERIAAGRDTLPVQTAWGVVHLKQKILGGEVIASAPEYEDCAALARAHGVPLVQVYAAAMQGATVHKTVQHEDAHSSAG
jgi:hypothetical protein